MLILRRQSSFNLKRGDLTNPEKGWRDRYDYLCAQGYQLRERFKPGWKPSWDPETRDLHWKRAEDAQTFLDTRTPDVTRLSDGATVVLKILRAKSTVHEEAVATMFGKGPLAADPRNHCVPIYDVFPLPEKGVVDRVIVMPLLRVYDSPRFDTVGEIIAMFKQIFEGLHFMHLHHTAHRDCTNNNIMMDGSDMYPDGFHPSRPSMRQDHTGRAKHLTRTQRPSRYYLIDFGLSCPFAADDAAPRVDPRRAGDKTLPEFDDHPGADYDPFPADVYYMGNWVRTRFVNRYRGLDFMRPLMEDMVQRDPAARPTMAQVVVRFDEIVRGLSLWRLRSRPVKRKDNAVLGMYRAMGHWKRRVVFVATRRPAIPMPPSRPSKA